MDLDLVYVLLWFFLMLAVASAAHILVVSAVLLTFSRQFRDAIIRYCLWKLSEAGKETQGGDRK